MLRRLLMFTAALVPVARVAPETHGRANDTQRTRRHNPTSRETAEISKAEIRESIGRYQKPSKGQRHEKATEISVAFSLEAQIDE
jgi:hypothetical protein